MQSIFKLSAVIAAIGFAPLGMLPVAQAAVPADNATVVLVHGAFADGSSWEDIIPSLQSQRLKVVSAATRSSGRRASSLTRELPSVWWHTSCTA